MFAYSHRTPIMTTKFYSKNMENILKAKFSEFFWILAYKKFRRSRCKKPFVDIYHGFRGKTKWSNTG